MDGQTEGTDRQTDAAHSGVCFCYAAARSRGCGGATATFGEIAPVRAGCPAPAQGSDWLGSTGRAMHFPYLKVKSAPNFPVSLPPMQLL